MGKTLELSAYVNGHWFQSRAGVGHPDKISPPSASSRLAAPSGFSCSITSWDVFIGRLPTLKVTTQSSEAFSKINHRASSKKQH